VGCGFPVKRLSDSPLVLEAKRTAAVQENRDGSTGGAVGSLSGGLN